MEMFYVIDNVAFHVCWAAVVTGGVSGWDKAYSIYDMLLTFIVGMWYACILLDK